jgi:CelD/BcsL family acetyltransferase involved in cellulose biosynthesis
MRIVVLRKIPDEPSLLRQWDDLVPQMERPEVFYTCEWALAVQSAYQASLKPLLFLGYDGDGLVGVASLGADLADKNASFLAATTADYCDFLSHPQRRGEFADAVFAELRQLGIGSVVLASLPADSATPAAVRAAAEKYGLHAYTRPSCLCAQVQMGSSEQRQQLKTALSGYRKFRRYIRAMEREAPVKFIHLRSQAQIQAALPDFADAHVARFQANQRTSFLSAPERRCFLEELGRRFSGSEVVTLSMLMIGDRPVAWNYGFQFQGSWFIYQATFDRSQEEHSPGHCLLSRIVTEACDMDGMNVVDLGLGAEGYKERFGNSTRQTLDVTMTKSWSRHLREIVRYRTASALKRSPKLESAVRHVLRRSQTPRESAPGSKSI